MNTDSVLLTILAGGLVVLVTMSIVVIALIILILGRFNRLSKKAELSLLALTGWKWLNKRKGNK